MKQYRREYDDEPPTRMEADPSYEWLHQELKESYRKANRDGWVALIFAFLVTLTFFTVLACAFMLEKKREENKQVLQEQQSQPDVHEQTIP